MSKKLLICEQFAWSPEPAKNLDGRIPVKEGKSLPNSIEEDVGNFLLTPAYSYKQLRRIKRMHLSKTRDVKRQSIRNSKERQYE